jgi:hypothetical protein
MHILKNWLRRIDESRLGPRWFAERTPGGATIGVSASCCSFTSDTFVPRIDGFPHARIRCAVCGQVSVFTEWARKRGISRLDELVSRKPVLAQPRLIDTWRDSESSYVLGDPAASR